MLRLPSSEGGNSLGIIVIVPGHHKRNTGVEIQTARFAEVLVILRGAFSVSLVGPGVAAARVVECGSGAQGFLVGIAQTLLIGDFQREHEHAAPVGFQVVFSAEGPAFDVGLDEREPFQGALAVLRVRGEIGDLLQHGGSFRFLPVGAGLVCAS